MDDSMKPLDFIAVGDIVTDAFIRLKDAKVTCDIDETNCLISMRFGDKIPYESVTVVKGVGNSPNAAVAAARLGLRSGLVSDLGDDQTGAEMIEQLRQEGVATNYLTVHPGQFSNYHYVLWYESDRTILVKHEAYNYRWPILPAEMPPRWLYLSSLGPAAGDYQRQIIAYLESRPEVKLVFQPGTFQLELGAELKPLYRRAAAVFMNADEARRLIDVEIDNIVQLLDRLTDWGPELIIITDGPRGSYLRKGRETWFMPIYPDPAPAVDRTGAGDAFASTFAAALALGRSPLEALAWSPINSMSVVQQIGAQAGLLSRKELIEYLKNAPADYRAKKI